MNEITITTQIYSCYQCPHLKGNNLETNICNLDKSIIRTPCDSLKNIPDDCPILKEQKEFNFKSFTNLAKTQIERENGKIFVSMFNCVGIGNDLSEALLNLASELTEDSFAYSNKKIKLTKKAKQLEKTFKILFPTLFSSKKEI